MCAHLPLQYSSPSLSVTVVDSKLFPQMAQRKQVLCQGCSSSKGENHDVPGPLNKIMFVGGVMVRTFPAPITFSAA